MARVTAFTADRMLEIENSTVVSGFVGLDGHLLLARRDGVEIDAGNVKGDKGDKGDPGENAVIPDRLSSGGQKIEDWNLAVESGFYYATANTAANSPTIYAAVGIVKRMGGADDRVTQEVSVVSTTYLGKGLFKRSYSGGSWSPWRQTVPLYGGVIFAGTGGALYRDVAVAFPSGYFLSTPRVVFGNSTTASGAGIVVGSYGVTASGFTARAVSTRGEPFSSTYDIPFSALEEF